LRKGPEFDSVRDKEALAKLPEAERAAWQQLWADVETLLKKTAAARAAFCRGSPAPRATTTPSASPPTDALPEQVGRPRPGL
jgi:hypothetical protein